MVVPYISGDDVGATLASLIHNTRGAEASGLQHLLLVDLIVTAPDMPASDQSRSLAVRELLNGEITRALTEQRSLFGLGAPGVFAPLSEARAALAEDAGTGAHELLAWSVLYYRYVRSDLALSVETLADLIAVHTRTITRYTDEGIEMLTQRLIRAEQRARSAQLERRLYAMLPYSVPVRLSGREALLRSAEEALPTLSPRHVLITGTTGIGKTTFVQELLRRQIAAGRLDHLVWLDQPGSVQFVRQQIAEVLLREDEQIALRDYLLLYRVAVVLDEIEAAAAEREAFANLMRDLGAALVCVISRVYLPLAGVEAHLSLTEIERADAEAVIFDMLRLRPSLTAADRHEIAHDLYEHVGGNPLALKLAAGLWEYSERWAALEAEVHEQLFGRLFDALDAQEKWAWGALALFPRPAGLDDLAALWGITLETVGTLLRLALVEQRDDGAYRLVGGAREYIQRQYAADDDIRRLFGDLIDYVQSADGAFEVMEYVLVTDFPALDPERCGGWIDALWAEGLKRGHWARWRAILEDYMGQGETVAPDVRIAYGICLRRLADWESAQQVFYNVALQCGRSGRFAEQARALVEWSVLAKYRGEYEQALSLIGQAKRYAQRAHDDDLLRSLTLQEAQILIQQGSAGDAYKLLATLPETARVLALQSEAQLALANYNTCRSLALRALKLIGDDPATEASLYTIIGRSYERQSDHAQAHGYLTDVVTLLERSDDPFSLARAQTNLAAVLIPMGRYPDAGTLLSRAEQVQARLGDKVGLNTTRHNRGILRGYIAR